MHEGGSRRRKRRDTHAPCSVSCEGEGEGEGECRSELRVVVRDGPGAGRIDFGRAKPGPAGP